MCQFQVKTHREGLEYAPNHFFILSRGLNSGKPLKSSCPNCFVIIANSANDAEKIYWIAYALWQGRNFHQSLVGSVIPFIRKKDLQDMIQSAFQKVEAKPQAVEKTVSSLLQLEQQEANYQKLQKMVKLLKQTLVHQLINA
jgi:hypothetical protein